MRIKLLLRVSLGTVLLMILPFFFILFFIINLPFILISFLYTENKIEKSNFKVSHKYNKNIIFNRIDDISKLYGCKTRNHFYRWSIFKNGLNRLKPLKNKKALDFGAGSLIDTFELATLGFKVISFDINEKQLIESYKYYEWNNVPNKPELKSEKINSDFYKSCFDLITAYDVIEHLENLDFTMELLYSILKPRGLLFISVPESHSIREIFNRFMFNFRKKSGMIKNNPGLYHVNFKSSSEWICFFKKKRF